MYMYGSSSSWLGGAQFNKSSQRVTSWDLELMFVAEIRCIRSVWGTKGLVLRGESGVARYLKQGVQIYGKKRFFF